MNSEVTEIRLGGLGGQGVILAGLLLGQAAVEDGLYAAGSNSYGAQARGSACKADLVVADAAIDYPHVHMPQLLVAMSQGAYDAFAPGVDPEGVVLYDSALVTPSDKPGQHGLAVSELADQVLGGRQAANVVWVGAVAGATGWFSEAAVNKAMEIHVPERFMELNRKALSQGLALGQALRKALEMEAGS